MFYYHNGVFNFNAEILMILCFCIVRVESCREPRYVRE